MTEVSRPARHGFYKCLASSYAPKLEKMRTETLDAGKSFKVNELLADIIHCDVLAQCKAGAALPCSRIVEVQDDVPLPQHQVPEPWTGDLEGARIVFISSNPSISYDEPYPVWGEEKSSIEDFFVNRFGAEPGQIKDGMYPPVRGGGWGPAIRFWSSVRQRAFEVLPDAEPGVDYALTEVVHCKSRNEIGVQEALDTCSERYLPRIVESSSHARLFVVYGIHASKTVSKVLGITLDTDNRVARFERQGIPRTVVYLDHPSSGGKVKRLASALSPEELTSVTEAIANA